MCSILKLLHEFNLFICANKYINIFGQQIILEVQLGTLSKSTVRHLAGLSDTIITRR